MGQCVLIHRMCLWLIQFLYAVAKSGGDILAIGPGSSKSDKQISPAEVCEQSGCGVPSRVWQGSSKSAYDKDLHRLPGSSESNWNTETGPAKVSKLSESCDGDPQMLVASNPEVKFTTNI